jgi:hypothetical protein
MQASSRGGETILIVDDDELVLPATKSLIEGLAAPRHAAMQAFARNW